MSYALLRWFVLTVAVWIAAIIVPGIDYEGWTGLLIAALVLGILNTVVRPILSLLSLPFIIPPTSPRPCPWASAPPQ